MSCRPAPDEVPVTRVFVAVVIAAAVLAPVVPAAQDQTFRGGIHTVSVYASVLDRAGRLVTDLTKDDFEVYDDGRRQELAVFANVNQPITIVVMLDRSGSVSRHFALVRNAATAFVNNLTDTDRARIGSFSHRVQVDPPRFTADKGELTRILHEELQDAGATPLWNAASIAMQALDQEPGRRVILMFTDGYDNPGGNGPNTTFPEVRDRAQADEVMVYGIGLADDCGAANRMPSPFNPARFQARRPGRGGPMRRPPGGMGRPPRPPIPIPIPSIPGGRGRFPRPGEPLTRPPASPPADPCAGSRPDPALRELAIESGGGYFELRDAEHLGSTFARVADELHQQYLLGFTPAALDGKTHTLEVRVRDPGMTVRARKSYLAQPK
jgi:VWFA-related protein